MTQACDTTRVFIPLTQRRRNGRARIVPLFHEHQEAAE